MLCLFSFLFYVSNKVTNRVKTFFSFDLNIEFIFDF